MSVFNKNFDIICGASHVPFCPSRLGSVQPRGWLPLSQAENDRKTQPHEAREKRGLCMVEFSTVRCLHPVSMHEICGSNRRPKCPHSLLFLPENCSAHEGNRPNFLLSLFFPEYPYQDETEDGTRTVPGEQSSRLTPPAGTRVIIRVNYEKNKPRKTQTAT